MDFDTYQQKYEVSTNVTVLYKRAGACEDFRGKCAQISCLSTSLPVIVLLRFCTET